MCGIAGIFTPSGSNLDYLDFSIRLMTKSLEHRGPDSSDYWVQHDGTLALGHQRLAVEDLSIAGSQPMFSPSGQLVLTFNGEIYNHKEIRSQLEREKLAPRWKGTSDTETLAVALEAWGIKRTLSKLSGMFACGVWDRKNRVLNLFRDRMGEKPLYFGWCGGKFYFASELRAIEKLPDVDLTIDADSLGLFLRYTYVPGPRTIYLELNKLPPGCYACISADNGFPLNMYNYWSILDCAYGGQAAPFKGDDVDAQSELERLLSKSVGHMMSADVPVGAFLSGGVDSCGVVSEMARLSPHPVQTFTLGFGEPGYDETTHARLISQRLGTDHHEAIITEDDALRVVPELGQIYDEPFADSSQIPTLLISRAARQHVTVALTGDGGDEIFGGYPRHTSATCWRNRMARYPNWMRQSLGDVMNWAVAITVHATSRRVIPGTHNGLRKLAKISNILSSSTLGELYSEWVTHWRPVDGILRQNNCKKLATDGMHSLDPVLSKIGRSLMLIDTLTYLVDEILVKVDRAAMSTSLETRAPYLNHEIVEFAWTLPMHHIIHKTNRKPLLKSVVESRISPFTLTPVKTGFAVPLGIWLRNGLREWVEEMLRIQTPASSILEKNIINRVWKEHLQGNKDNSSLLWSVLMFKSWAIHRGK